MTALHQLIPVAAPFDAIDNEAFAMRDALRALGYESELFAENIAPGMSRDVKAVSKFSDGPADALLLHYALWSDVVELALEARGPLLVRYHNVTPPEWFEEVNDVLADQCRRGRAGLPLLASRATLAIAASEFNRHALVTAGFERTTVVPILLPEKPIRGHADSRSSPLVLTIGRIAPNKRIDEVLRAFTLFQRVCRPDARLSIVGAGGASEAYERACKRLAARLGVRGVAFAGQVSEDEKERLLAEAAVYVSLSEHEGFSIPIVEAMRHGVPVLARAAGAVPETVGEGGIVVDTRDYAELAELLDLLVSDEGVRAGVAAGQRRQLRRFEPAAVREKLGAAVDSVLASR